MGFAIIPGPPSPGVYLHKEGNFLFLVTEAAWLLGVYIIYKPRQRKPRQVSTTIIRHSIYLGEL